jgi:hypothetical protein
MPAGARDRPLVQRALVGPVERDVAEAGKQHAHRD